MWEVFVIMWYIEGVPNLSHIPSLEWVAGAVPLVSVFLRPTPAEEFVTDQHHDLEQGDLWEAVRETVGEWNEVRELTPLRHGITYREMLFGTTYEDCSGLASLALTIRNGKTTANIQALVCVCECVSVSGCVCQWDCGCVWGGGLHLITVELGRAVRTARGKPKPRKYGQFFSTNSTLWWTIQPNTSNGV